MEFIPAIDLLDGFCVRLRQGSYNDVDRYQLDPVEVANGFVKAGARRIHLVDLNAARGADEDERKGNRDIIRRIVESVPVGVEVGGGVRSENDIEELLTAGVSHVVIGTALARKPEQVAAWAKRFGPVCLAGIDAKDGQVLVAGWEQSSGLADTELAKIAADVGCAGIVYTNIARDGMMQGPDLERTNLIASSAGIPVILSGGVSSMEDLRLVANKAHPLLAGIISGRAIYEKAIDVEQAVKLVREQAAGNARLWNLDGKWQPNTLQVKPAMVIDGAGEVRAVVQQNAKAMNKTCEQKKVWQYVAENGRVLPYEMQDHTVLQVIDHGPCIEIKSNFNGSTGIPGDSAAPVRLEAGEQSELFGQVLTALERLVKERKQEMPAGSYTTHLFSAGESKIRKKTGEEAVELVLATTDSEIVSESADFLYHLIVLLVQRGIPLAEVIRELSKR